MKTKDLYNKQNAIKALKAFLKAYGEIKTTKEFLKKTIPKNAGPLAGKTLASVKSAFDKNRIPDVPDGTTMMAVVKSEKIYEGVFTKANIMKALRAFLDEYGEIKTTKEFLEKTIPKDGGPLAGRALGSIKSAFDQNRIPDVPDGTSLNHFVGMTLKNSNLKIIKPREISLKQVFNSVAWKIIKNNDLKENFDTSTGVEIENKPIYIDLTDTQIPNDELNSIISVGALMAGPRFEYSWQEIIDDAKQGEIDGLNRDFDLATFATEIEERILDGNMECPTIQECNDWKQKRQVA